MIHLNTQEEKELWKVAAANAIATVEGASAEDGKRVLSFMNVIADGAVLAYRKRCADEAAKHSPAGN